MRMNHERPDEKQNTSFMHTLNTQAWNSDALLKNRVREKGTP